MAPTARKFTSGASALSWLTGRGDPEAPRRTPAQLDAEIAAELGRGPVLTPGNARPLPPFPAGRAGAGAARATRPRVTKPAASSRGRKTAAQFLVALPAPLSRRGKDSVSTSVIAKQIKADCAAAVDAGVLPDGTKVSASTDHNSIRVDITAWHGAVFSEDYEAHLLDPKVYPWNPEHNYRAHDRARNDDPRLSRPLNDALEFIERLANRHNYDNSDRVTDYFDVGYYLTVSADPVIRITETAIKAGSDKQFQALLSKAHDAARVLGPAATKSICGSKDLAHADEYCITKLLKLAERAAGRPVIHDPRRGWIPDDGSTAKVAGLPTLQLGKTTYSIAGGGPAEGNYTLIGPRGSHSYLVRARANKTEQERGQVSSSWSHNMNGRSTWWTRNADGTFGNPH